MDSAGKGGKETKENTEGPESEIESPSFNEINHKYRIERAFPVPVRITGPDRFRPGYLSERESVGFSSKFREKKCKI
jgi:hypothetical protein